MINNLEIKLDALMNQNENIMKMLIEQQKTISHLLTDKDKMGYIPYIDMNKFGPAVSLEDFLNTSQTSIKKKKRCVSFDLSDLNKQYELNNSFETSINNKCNKLKKIDLDFRNFNLDSLIDFLNKNEKIYKNKGYLYIDFLFDIKKELLELQNMVGMDCIKDEILDFVFHFINRNQEEYELVNFTISGEPGVGKTTVAKIFASILSKLNIVKNEITTINASELIGTHVGETTKKTREAISHISGIVLIDEIYSLGSPSGLNDYGQEFANVIISDIEIQKILPTKDRRIYAFLGYEKETREYIFNKNKGLKSRFPFNFNLLNPSVEELKVQFLDKIKKKIDIKSDEIFKEIDNIFDKCEQYYFPANGRSIENLINYIMIVNSRKINYSKELDKNDVIEGFKRYCSKLEKNADLNNNKELMNLYS